MERGVEAAPASPHVGVGVLVDGGPHRQGDTVIPHGAAVLLVVLAVQQDPGGRARRDELVQVRPADHRPPSKLVVEGVVAGGRVLVGADGREHVVLQAGDVGDQDGVRGHVQDLVVVAPEDLHGSLHLAQGVRAEGVLEQVALVAAGHLGRVGRGEQGLRVRRGDVKGLALEGHVALPLDGAAVQGRAELLPGPVVAGQEGRRLLAHVHDLGVLDHLLGDGEGVLPGLIDQQLLIPLLHAVVGVGAVLAHGLEAVHGGHAGQQVAVVLAGAHQEQVLDDGQLLEGLAPLLQEHPDGRLALTVDRIGEAAALRKCDTYRHFFTPFSDLSGHQAPLAGSGSTNRPRTTSPWAVPSRFTTSKVPSPVPTFVPPLFTTRREPTTVPLAAAAKVVS